MILPQKTFFQNIKIITEGNVVKMMNLLNLYFRVISEHNVNGLFVAPTALRAIKMADPHTVKGHKYNIER